ncbi:hypothetical protein CIL05_07010 [Virgibacillus profundi]|uniref:Uncharacterized protein n=1 Tax=Virgibacillus profundi TaxID=2024555 RepID=A0A2A2IEQ1_9BACI|nr:hypothetical protein [Virgibacillus profundi]PAV30209.1 hypothetical protein CIL05_07010 [Virgibacillus profundi]PXY54381.1 hypothetical protein CIT14_07095 [Virgibacillus profundi]
MKTNLYQKFKKYQVSNVSSVREFIERYYKPTRLKDTQGMEGRKERLISNYEKELKECGYCFISHHDNITGEVVSFYG